MAHHPTYVVPPTEPHTHTIIFLHGRGSDATTFCSELFESQDSSSRFLTDIFPSIRWVFPCAPKTHAKTEKEEMSQWFDMSSVQSPQEELEVQKPGLWESMTMTLGIINEEADIVGLGNVLVAGISQGCAVSIFTLLESGLQVGGFIGLSGWLPLAEEIVPLMDVPGRTKDVLRTPVLLQHCEDDPVVPFGQGQKLRDELKKLGMAVEWQSFRQGGHWLNEPDGMGGMVKFIQDFVKAS